MLASMVMALALAATPADSADSLKPWRASMYIGTHYGTPNGARFDAGFTISEGISLGMHFNIMDQWSRDPDEGMLGFHLRFFIPLSYWITPYAMAATGGTVEIFGEGDSYVEIVGGAMVPLNRMLILRPEIGFSSTSRWVSGGHSMWGSSTPEVREKREHVLARIGIELVLRQLFR